MSKVAITRFTDPQEAMIAAGALRAQGIDAEVFDYNHGEVALGIQKAFGCRLMVEERDLEAARAILTDIHGAPPVEPENPPAASWTMIIFAGLIIFALIWVGVRLGR